MDLTEVNQRAPWRIADDREARRETGEAEKLAKSSSGTEKRSKGRHNGEAELGERKQGGRRSKKVRATSARPRVLIIMNRIT
jgi:hypothetical protein